VSTMIDDPTERDEYDWARDEAEQDWANRWLEAWDRLEDLGVVSHPEDSNMTLADLERISGYLGGSDD
jgi:hypothetical protein